MITAAVVLVTLAVLYHGLLEYGGGPARVTLAKYMGRIVGFRPAAWVGGVFLALAVGNMLGPLVVGYWLPGLRTEAWSYVAGAALGDIFGTHLVPTFLPPYRVSPATSTWWMYFAVSAGMTWLAWPLDLVFFQAGILSFLVLWPGLVLLRMIGVLKKE